MLPILQVAGVPVTLGAAVSISAAVALTGVNSQRVSS